MRIPDLHENDKNEVVAWNAYSIFQFFSFECNIAGIVCVICAMCIQTRLKRFLIPKKKFRLVCNFAGFITCLFQSKILYAFCEVCRKYRWFIKYFCVVISKNECTFALSVMNTKFIKSQINKVNCAIALWCFFFSFLVSFEFQQKKEWRTSNASLWFVWSVRMHTYTK